MLTNSANVCFASPFHLIPFGTLVCTKDMKTQREEPGPAASQQRWTKERPSRFEK